MARTVPQQAASRERERDALLLRKQGSSYDEIADQLGYANRGGAYKAVQRALLATIKQPAEDVRLIELERLDEAFRAVWPQAMDDTNPHQLRAMDTLLRIMDRSARMSGLQSRRPPNGEQRSRRRDSTDVLVITPEIHASGHGQWASPTSRPA